MGGSSILARPTALQGIPSLWISLWITFARYCRGLQGWQYPRHPRTVVRLDYDPAAPNRCSTLLPCCFSSGNSQTFPKLPGLKISNLPVSNIRHDKKNLSNGVAYRAEAGIESPYQLQKGVSKWLHITASQRQSA